MAELPVDVWSDVACPWCWVGKRHLEEAARSFDDPVRVTWHAFELDPSAPRSVEQPFDYVDRLARKYGVTREHAQAMIDRMTEVGRASGLDFRFDRVRPGNTFDAHRLLHWALEYDLQNALKERLFLAYMHEGRSVSDPGVLTELTSEIGLDADRAAAILASDDYADAVRADEDAARRLGVSGVPLFVMGGRYAVPGAQKADVLLQVMQRARDDARSLESDRDTAAPACGPDGCAVE